MIRTEHAPYTKEELAEVAARYDSISVFREKERKVYEVIKSRRLQKELCAHMKSKRPIPYTEEQLAEVSAKYESLCEFREKEEGIYNKILKLGLLDKFCAHMSRLKSPCFTDDKLAEVAAKYDSLKDFREKEESVYGIICHRGLVKKLCAHMTRSDPAPVSNKYLAEIAAQYDSLKEFRKKEPNVYARIVKRGLLKELCSCMIHRDGCTIPEEELAAVAAKYHLLIDFIYGEPNTYAIIRRRGLLDKLCSHMKRTGNWVRRKVYVFTFSDGYAYVGLSCNPARRYKQHTLGKEKSAVFSHIKATGSSFGFTILTDWLDIDAAGKVEDDYIKKYKADGWKMLNRMRGGGMGSTNGGYTRHMLEMVTEECTYIEDFKKRFPRQYRYIMRNNLFDELCGHMKHKE